jgi:hypothetical protein
MIDGVLRILVIALGLLVIWWLCGPVGQRDRPVGRERDETRERDARVDAQGR